VPELQIAKHPEDAAESERTMTSTWGTIYLVAPDDSAEIVETHENARSRIDVASELWNIVGEDRHANAIDDLMRTAFSRKPPSMSTGEITELLRLTDGLEQRLTSTVLDSHWQVSRDALPALRSQTRTLALGEQRGELATAGVGEGLLEVLALRRLLELPWKQTYCSRSNSRAADAGITSVARGRHRLGPRTDSESPLPISWITHWPWIGRGSTPVLEHHRRLGSQPRRAVAALLQR
jgi:hypothetical protein